MLSKVRWPWAHLLIALMLFYANLSQADEPWKGASDPNRFNVGAMAGVDSIANKTVGWVRPIIGIKILDRGFVPEINDQVYLDLQTAPVVGLPSGDQAWLGGAGIRWMFYHSPELAYYALGGLRFLFNNDQFASEDNGIHGSVDAAFGIGVAWSPVAALQLRAEFGYNELGLGIVASF